MQGQIVHGRKGRGSRHSGAVDIGKKLKERADQIQQAEGISQAEVARRCGMSEKRFNNYVLNLRRPSYEVLVKLCHSMRMTPNWVFGFAEVPSGLSPQEVQLLGRFRDAGVTQKDILLAAAESYANNPGTGYDRPLRVTR